jgi:putative intracellular protease/amidase
MRKQLLIVATSQTTMGEGGKATGIWAEELVVPYLAFVDAGAEVTLASPLGGALRFDAASLKPKGSNSSGMERFLNDPQAQRQAQATVTTQTAAAEVEGGRFDAVFFPGGHGTMWDFPSDAGVRRIVAAAYAQKKVVGSVCHGAAALVGAKRSDGQPVVQGHRINSFTDAEEVAVGLKDVVPFLLESRLRELGARFEGAANWQAFAVHDGVFVTGQNPQSSALVAKHVVAALGLAQVGVAA